MKNIKEGHTPIPLMTPFEVKNIGMNPTTTTESGEILDRMGRKIHTGSMEYLQALEIVRAVNSHEALVKAVKLALSACHTSEWLENVAPILKEAIAQAEGK